MKPGKPLNRRRFLRTSAAGVAGLGTSMFLYAWCWEPHWLELVEHQLSIANLPDRLAGARLVQLSDLHIGPRVSESYLIHTFERVKALAPEIVVYTGDFTCYSEDIFARAQRLFPRVCHSGARGTFGILGNHDYGPGLGTSGCRRSARRAGGAMQGVRVLRNEVTDDRRIAVGGTG
jgi:uncharacterized protein